MERAMQKATRAARVDNELRAKTDAAPPAHSFERGSTDARRKSFEHGFVHVFDALRLRLMHEELIDVRAKPMSVSNSRMRTRGDEQLPQVLGIVFEPASRAMCEKTEAAFQTAGNLRIALLPGTPFGEREKTREIVARSQLLQNEVGERSGRFADGKARMLRLLDQDDGKAETSRDHRQE